jgi:hypothetical protein
MPSNRTPSRVLLGSTIALTAMILVLGALPSLQRLKFYRPFGIPALNLPFADMNYIFASLDCARRGIPTTSVCPAAGYSFIYPKTFYLLLPTGLSAGDSRAAVIVTFLVFSLSVPIFLDARSWKECFYYLIILVSPPVILALERGNIDLLVISLVAIAAIQLEARHMTSLALAWVFLAAMLKVYPFLAILVGFGRVRRLYVLVAGLAIVAGFWIQLDQLRYISRHVEQTALYSWGYPVPFIALRAALGKRNMAWLIPQGVDHIAQILSPLLCLVVALALIRSRRTVSLMSLRHGPAMLAGSSMYCFCWLLGTNFDYRYLVLLLAMPFLFDAASTSAFKAWAKLALLCMPTMFWLAANPRHTILVLGQQLVTWLVFMLLLTGTIAYIIEWGRNASLLTIGAAGSPDGTFRAAFSNVLNATTRRTVLKIPMPGSGFGEPNIVEGEATH